MSVYLPISVAVPLVGVGEAGVEVGQSLLYQSVSLSTYVAVPLVGVGEAGVEVGKPLLFQSVCLSTYLCGCTSGRGLERLVLK